MTSIDDSLDYLEEYLRTSRCFKVCQCVLGPCARLLLIFLDKYFLLVLLMGLKAAVRGIQIYTVVVTFVRSYYPPAAQAVLVVVSTGILFQAGSNFLRIKLTDPGRPPMASDSQPSCRKCGRLRVDRSHHCSKCKECTLLMDHHCCTLHTDLVGACIGLNNTRFFFLWLYWIVVGGIVGTIVSVWPVIQVEHSSTLERNCLSFCLSLSAAVRSTQLSIVVFFLLWTHYQGILRGQTTIEAVKHDRQFDRGVRKNWEALFGKSHLWMFGVYTGGMDLPLTV